MKKVLLAMSGGVDSAACAILLQKKGFEPIGVHFKFWPLNNRCCTLRTEQKARKICQDLKIPFYVFDLKKQFQKEIVKPFLKSLSQGVTPNPCVWCNRKIKFKTLEKYRKLLKADLVSTGHYAILKDGSLFQAKDKKKDQSYFLWQLEDLKNILFPLGELKKEEVRKIAKDYNFSRESQEICFVENKLEDFLKKHLKEKKGDIIFQGKKVSEHQGLFYYTIGQRKGIDLANGPFYVLKKDVKKNNLIITKDEKDLFKKELKMKKVNWLEKVSFPLECSAKVRYRGDLKKVRVENRRVVFSSFQKAVTPGQSIVFYRKEKVLGGGIII